MEQTYQKNIKELVDKYGRENLIVLLGFVDVELIEIYGLTLTVGDPSGIGPLSGVALRLPVYHILEPEIKAQIPEAVFQEQVGMMEIAASENLPEIIKILKKARIA